MNGKRGLAFVMMTALCVPAGIVAAADTTPGPLMRAALAGLEAEQAKSPPPRSERARTDWSRVRRLRAGGDIILTVKGSGAMTYRLLQADENGLVILDTTDPALPADVRKTLVQTASDRPLNLVAVPPATEMRLARGVRITQGAVFLREQRVTDLAVVVRTVPRDQIADLRVSRKHVGTHSRRGFLIGAAIGAGVGAAAAASCDSRADCSVPLVAFLGALGGGVWGLEIGTIVGIVAPRSPDVIYHVD